MIKSIDEYLDQLKAALKGGDTATIQASPTPKISPATRSVTQLPPKVIPGTM